MVVICILFGYTKLARNVDCHHRKFLFIQLAHKSLLYFCLLQIVDEVVSNIERKVAQIETYLEASGSEMSEEVRGKVLAAVGKARLLVSQKIQQFQGLCHKNIVSKQILHYSYSVTFDAKQIMHVC